MRCVTFFLYLFFALSNLIYTQSISVDSFDSQPTELDYWQVFITQNSDSEKAFIEYKYDSLISHQGSSSLNLTWGIHLSENFGGLSRIQHFTKSDSLIDLSIFDTLSFWYYNEIPSSITNAAEFRFLLYDASNSNESSLTPENTENYYSFHYILDDSPGWNEIKIPIEQVLDFNNKGFSLTNWSGITGNAQLDRDKIAGFAFEFASAFIGGNDQISGSINIDAFSAFSKRERSDYLFNGMFVPGNVQLNYIGNHGSIKISEEKYYSNDKSLKWITSTSELLSGPEFQLQNVLDYSMHWEINPFAFIINNDEFNGSIRIVISDDDIDGDGPDRKFEAVYNIPSLDLSLTNGWHKLSIPLAEFNRFSGCTEDGIFYPGEMDSSRISSIKILISDPAGFGQTVYLDNILFGKDSIFQLPTPITFFITPDSKNYRNNIYWVNNPSNPYETYNIYYSRNEISSENLHTSEVEVLRSNIPNTDFMVQHDLICPLNDSLINLNYLVTREIDCNESLPVNVLSQESKTKGAPVIYFKNGFQFSADGNLNEWRGFVPFRMYPSDSSGTIVDGTNIFGDDDLSANIYLVCNSENLYAAIEVNDDSIFAGGNDNPWNFDSPELFIGLYNWHNISHSDLQNGAEPDYHLNFSPNGILDYLRNELIITNSSPDYIWSNISDSSYIIEAKIPFETFVKTGIDSIFNPIHNQRIPIDFLINDAEPSAGRQGILTYSKYNQDESWRDVSRWTNTWIWDMETKVKIIEQNEFSFSLFQNFPNPFNTSTVIQYTIPGTNEKQIKLIVYNSLGQVIKILVDKSQSPGKHSIPFNCEELASGIYFYQLISGDLHQTKKLLLLK